MKNLRNEIALASTEKLMRSYTSGTRDVVLLTFIKIEQCWKRRQRRSKKDFKTVVLKVLVPHMGG